MKLELVAYAAHLAVLAVPSDADLHFAGMQLVAHSAGGLLVLFVPLILSIYKPRRMTPYGLRKQQDQRPNEIASIGRSLENVRRQVTAPMIAVTLLVLTFLLLHLLSGHVGGHGR